MSVAIGVTNHARQRAWERLSDSQTDGRIKHDVEQALLEGRTARHRPFFLGPGARAEDGAVFCWPSDADRCYLLIQNAPGVFAVKTVLTPDFSSIGVGSAGAV